MAGHPPAGADRLRGPTLDELRAQIEDTGPRIDIGKLSHEERNRVLLTFLCERHSASLEYLAKSDGGTDR